MSLHTKGELELLAPAGSFEAFKAAVENGADAIYLGGKSFNARASAANFDLEQLRQAVKYAHERQVKVYVTVNILIADQEFPELIDYLYELHQAGVDAVILQDIGVASFINSVLPEMEIHASTQMTVNTTWGVKQLESLGFLRAVLARETSAQEMREITSSTKLDIEVFVHGALCICYSGQCLMSSFIGGRSGNRGTCAQPCRLTYNLVNKKKEDVLVKQQLGEHLLSPRDLNLVEELKTLRDSGVYSLKVEGRMKRPEYVATVTRIYRQALNALSSGPKGNNGSVAEEHKRELAQIFNRDFTTGYLMENQGLDLMSYSRPNNRGIRLGRVIGSSDGRLKLKLDTTLRNGDGIEIWTGRGREGIYVTNMWSSSAKVEEALAGETIEVEFNGQARPGDRVFKTHDEALMEKARLSFQEGKEQRKRPLYMKLSGTAGEKLKLEVRDDFHSVSLMSDGPAQEAIKRPLTFDYVQGQFSRLGGTPFYLDQLDLDLDGSIMIPVSELNEMRRTAVEQLLNNNQIQRTVKEAEYRKRVENWKKSLSLTKQNSSAKRDKVSLQKAQVSVAVSDLECLKAAIKQGANRILVGGERWRSRKGLTIEQIQAALELCSKAGAEGVWRLPRILNQEQSTRWLEVLKKANQWKVRPKVMVSNIGQIEMIKSIDSAWPYEIDFSVNVFNESTLAYFLKDGAERVALSPELNQGQLRILSVWPQTELMVFGDIEMMVSEYCPIGATLGGRKGYNCSRPCTNDAYFLRDRKKYDFPVETDLECRMHLFNVKRLNLLAELEQIYKMGISDIRIQLSRATPEQVGQVVSAFSGLWQKVAQGKNLSEQEIEAKLELFGELFPEGFTKGHFFRGVV